MECDEQEVSLLLGSNMGNRMEHLERALRRLSDEVGELVCYSAAYETAAWGKTDQPAFLNMAVMLKSRLTPLNLLASILYIEKEMGRVREEKWGERIIDIDILLYGEHIVSEPELSIPHSEMHNRRFALVPLYTILPEGMHPTTGKTIAELLSECPDPLSVKLYSPQTNE